MRSCLRETSLLLKIKQRFAKNSPEKDLCYISPHSLIGGQIEWEEALQNLFCFWISQDITHAAAKGSSFLAHP